MKLRYIYRSLLFVIGVFFILLGFVGLLLPVVPQVPFFFVGGQLWKIKKIYIIIQKKNIV